MNIVKRIPEYTPRLGHNISVTVNNLDLSVNPTVYGLYLVLTSYLCQFWACTRFTSQPVSFVDRDALVTKYVNKFVIEALDPHLYTLCSSPADHNMLCFCGVWPKYGLGIERDL